MTRLCADKLIVFVSGLGMLLSTLDTGIINVALPSLEKIFFVDTSVITWAITGYSLALGTCILPFGIMGDLYGKVRISRYGFITFGIGSLLCGIAENIQFFILGRVVQGIGAAMLQATSIALITTFLDEKKRYSALGTLGMMIGLGPILGPSLGGIALTYDMWRILFLVNVPLVLIALIAFISISSSVKERESNLSITQYYKQGKSIISWKINLHFAQTAVFGFASAILFLLPPFIFSKIFNLPMGIIGVLVLSAPVGLVVFAKLSSKWGYRWKSTELALLGILTMSSSMFFLIMGSHYLGFILVGLFVYGAGGGIFQPANMASIMAESPKTVQGVTGAIQRMVQNISISIGAGVGGYILSIYSDDIYLAATCGWGVSLLVLILGFVSRYIVKYQKGYPC